MKNIYRQQITMAAAVAALSERDLSTFMRWGHFSCCFSSPSWLLRFTKRLIAKQEREENQKVIKNSALLLAEVMLSVVRKSSRGKTAKWRFKKNKSGVEKVEKEIVRLMNNEICILQMLISNRGDNYAYGLVDQSEGLLNRNGIYTTLARMELKGLVESETEKVRPGAKGKPRRIYKTTGLGQRSFADAQARMAAFNANWSTA